MVPGVSSQPELYLLWGGATTFVKMNLASTFVITSILSHSTFALIQPKLLRDRRMLGSVYLESGFDVSEGYVSDVYPERNDGVWQVGSVVVASDDVSE